MGEKYKRCEVVMVKAGIPIITNLSQSILQVPLSLVLAIKSGTPKSNPMNIENITSNIIDG